MVAGVSDGELPFSLPFPPGPPRHPATDVNARGVIAFGAGTIRNAYKHLYNDRNGLIDPKWIEGGKGDMTLLPPS